MNKKIKIISLILLVVILIAGIFIGNTYGLFTKGNSGKYSLKNTSAISGKREGSFIAQNSHSQCSFVSVLYCDRITHPNLLTQSR